MKAPPTGVGVDGRWLTWANGLTAVRALAVPALVVAILTEAHLAGLGLFVLALATDFADGRVARRLGQASRLGGLLDHAVDASFVVAGLGALASRGGVPVLLPVLIAGAFLQYALDSGAHSRQPLRASSLGRWNGIAYFILLGTPLVRDGLALGWPDPSWVTIGAWALVASTVFSIGERAAVSFGSRRRSRGSPGAGRTDRSPH